jgi:hypothetical protein
LHEDIHFWTKLITISEVMITLSELFIQNFIKSDLELGQFDNINQMITLSVITLSGLHCTNIPIKTRFDFLFQTIMACLNNQKYIVSPSRHANMKHITLSSGPTKTRLDS